MVLTQSELSRIARLDLDQVGHERGVIQDYIAGRGNRVAELQKLLDKTGELSFRAGVIQQKGAIETGKDYLRAYEVAEALLTQGSLT